MTTLRTKRPHAICATLLSFLCFFVPPSFAGTQSGKLVAIQVTGAKAHPTEQVIAASGLKIGDPVTREDIQAAADRLAQLGPFTAARFRFTSMNDDITVEFQMEEAPAVPVWFDNFPWFTDAELAEGLRQAVPLFNGTAPEQGGMLETMRATLEKLVATRGIRGRVERILVAAPSGEGMVQQFKVEGTGLKVDGMQFGDALATESRKLRDRLSDIVGNPYSRFAIEVFLNEQVRPVYLEKGFLKAHIGPPEARFTGSPNQPLPDHVLVVVPIQPGPAFKWGGVEWVGNAAFGPQALDVVAGLRKDEVADGLRIVGAWERVESEYQGVGYLDVKLAEESRYDDTAGRVSYRVTIQEGPQYKMGELVITGLSLAAERKLAQTWKIPRGQVFDRKYFQEFYDKLIDAAFSELPVHYENKGFWLRTNAEMKTVDVLIDFK